MHRVKGTYAALGNAGRQFTVVAKVVVSEDAAAADEGCPVKPEGVVSLETSHGVRLRRLEKGVYRLPSGEKLRSTDPEAP